METARRAYSWPLASSWQRCLCATLQRSLLGPIALFRDFLEMINSRRKFPMAPKVVGNGPGHTSTMKSWSHEWWEMVPTNIQVSTQIHRFIDRLICHGRYRHRPSIHVRRRYYGKIPWRSISTSTVDPPTVNIDIDRRSTYGKIRSIVDCR